MAADSKTSLKKTVRELSDLFDQIDESSIDKLAAALAEARAVYIAGAGRSGLLLRCFAMRIMHMGKPVHMVGDVVTPAATPGDLLLIGSGSGETGSLAALAEKAQTLGVRTALITINPKSRIAGMADLVTAIPAPSPKLKVKLDTAQSEQPMGSLFEQGMFLLLETIVMALMKRQGITSDDMFARHANLE